MSAISKKAKPIFSGISILWLFFLPVLEGFKKGDDIIRVSKYLKDMIPYRQGQIVKFVSDGNEVIIARVEIEQSIENCTACQPKEKREVLRFILRNTANVEYDKVAVLEIIDRAENLVFLTLYSPKADFISGMGFDVKTINRTSDFFTDNNVYFFHNEIFIGPTLYRNVLEINYSVYPNQMNYLPYALEYSREKGIIRFRYEDGKTYTLEN